MVISSSASSKEALQKQDLAYSTRSIPTALHAHQQYRYSIIWFLVSNWGRNLLMILNLSIFSSTRVNASNSLGSER